MRRPHQIREGSNAPSAPPADFLDAPPPYDESQRHNTYGWTFQVPEQKEENKLPEPEKPVVIKEKTSTFSYLIDVAYRLKDFFTFPVAIACFGCFLCVCPSSIRTGVAIVGAGALGVRYITIALTPPLPKNTLRRLTADNSKFIGDAFNLVTLPKGPLKAGDKVTFYTSVKNNFSKMEGGWSFNFFDEHYRNVLHVRNFNPKSEFLEVSVTACQGVWGRWSWQELKVPDQPLIQRKNYKSGRKQKTVLVITENSIEIQVEGELLGEIPFSFLKELNEEFDPKKDLVHMAFTKVILDGLSTRRWFTTKIFDFSENRVMNFSIPW